MILPTILGILKELMIKIGFHMMRIEVVFLFCSVHHFERCTLSVKTPFEEVLVVPGRGPTSPDLHKVHRKLRQITI